MKKHSLQFAVCLILGIAMIIPFHGQAQEKNKKQEVKRTYSVIITDSDTIVNGKKWDDMSKAEKKEFNEKQKELKANRVVLQRSMMEKDQKRRVIEKDVKGKKSTIIVDGEKINFSGNFDDDDLKDFVFVMPPSPPIAPTPPNFSFQFDNNMNFSFDDKDAQIFEFKSGDKNYNIKMAKVSEMEKRKITANREEEGIEINMSVNTGSDQITVSFSSKESSPLNISIYNDEGKKVKSEDVRDYKGGKYDKIYSLKDFEDGTYYIEFAQKEKKIMRKLVVRN